MFTKREIIARFKDRAAGDDPLKGDYSLACCVATAALIDATDKAGARYPHHLFAVSKHNTDSEAKMIIGVLHDLVEDTDWELDDLRTIGFSERIVAGVDGMTRRDDELYFDFIRRCSENPDSLDVKLKDLKHNLDQSRNNWMLNDKDTERINKYIISYQYLISVKKNTMAGSSILRWMMFQPTEIQNFDLVEKHSFERRNDLQITPGTTPPPQP